MQRNTVKSCYYGTLSDATDKQVTVKWSTLEGSAKNGADFIAVSGATHVFAPGEIQKNIEVQIVNDIILEFNDSFLLLLMKLPMQRIQPKKQKL